MMKKIVLIIAGMMFLTGLLTAQDCPDALYIICQNNGASSYTFTAVTPNSTSPNYTGPYDWQVTADGVVSNFTTASVTMTLDWNVEYHFSCELPSCGLSAGKNFVMCKDLIECIDMPDYLNLSGFSINHDGELNLVLNAVNSSIAPGGVNPSVFIWNDMLGTLGEDWQLELDENNSVPVNVTELTPGQYEFMYSYYKTGFTDCPVMYDRFSFVVIERCPEYLEIDYTGVLQPGNTILFTHNQLEMDCETEWSVNGVDQAVTGSEFQYAFQQAGTYDILVNTVAGSCKCDYFDEIQLVIPEIINVYDDNLCEQTVDLNELTDIQGEEIASSVVAVPFWFALTGDRFQLFNCLRSGNGINGVVKADATTYVSDVDENEEYLERINTYFYDESVQDGDYALVSEANAFEKGLRNIYRPETTNVFRKQTDPNKKWNYNHGTFSLDVFNWDSPSDNDPRKWVETQRITKYSGNGSPLETVNLMGIKSSIDYGYDFLVPVYQAANAAYGTVYFESYENESSQDILDSGIEMLNTRSGEQSHAGNYSAKITDPSGSLNIASVTNYHGLYYDGMIARVWVYLPKSDEGFQEGEFTLVIDGESVVREYEMQTLSTAGDWMLFDCTVPSEEFEYLQDCETLEISLTIDMSQHSLVYVDDVRVQPYLSEVNAFVYDEMLRPVASFDDQHFAVFYQYNPEGQLIRKMVETERGLRTIDETHYNIRRTVENPLD